ncbi:phage tail sheath family protein [Serinicoccus chungangensis]|uniref:phage tail sheath family protein n=1 Tax=Serinicoccus chungangensis TaxID=767452 RepID=UPI0011193701|nr:phage tail sheath subtilisin-like domain-containing protein [Serinicoccus chungangensis]
MPPPAPGAPGTPIASLPTAVVGFVGAADTGPVGVPVTVSSAADYHAVFGPTLDADRPLGHAVDLFFGNGGQEAVVVRAAGPAAEQLVPPAGPGGVHALDDAGVTVLVVPGLTTDHPDQVRVALARCAAYRAVLLLDLPAGPWSARTRSSLDGLTEHRERAATYHPWVVVDGQAVPPSGAVAGVVARTDLERGVWKAPAGVELRGIGGFTESLDRLRTDELTGAGVNALREFPGRGRLVWGARTLAGAGAGDPGVRYLPVRRLTDHVLRSLVAGLRAVEGEPNDPALWAQARRLTEDFLHALWRQGAFAGARADDAFGARCGPGETMTEADVSAGRVVVSFWMAPLRPAEFDVHTLTLQTAATPSDVPEAEGPDTDGSAGGRPDGPHQVSSRPDLVRVERRWTGLGRVDLGQVVSRYIGETEKNVGRVLDEAQGSGPALSFDEADALFGRRTRDGEAADRPEADDLPDEPAGSPDTDEPPDQPAPS